MTTHIAGLPTPNWAKWRLMPKVQIWQAAALSLNICPDWIRSLERTDGSELHQLLGPRIALVQELKDRCDIVSANVEELEAQKTDQYPEHAMISLRRFLEWAVRAEWKIPDELKAISSKVSPALIAKGEPQSGRRGATPQDVALAIKRGGAEGGRRSGEARRRKANSTWALHALELATKIRTDQPDISQEKLAGEIEARWKMSEVQCPTARTLRQHIANWERQEKLTQRLPSKPLRPAK